MIAASAYHPERLKETSRKLGRRVDPKMLEKVVYAFTLPEQLRANDISLIFKGGTCLLFSLFISHIPIVKYGTGDRFLLTKHLFGQTAIFPFFDQNGTI